MPPNRKNGLKGKPHPLYIPAIVNQIMSYLSVGDLLRARHVCRQWNEEASKYFLSRIKLRILKKEEVGQVHRLLETSKEMFNYPLEFTDVDLETHIRSRGGNIGSELFLSQFAPKLKTLTLKQSWNKAFPLNKFPHLEELTVRGNLNKHVGVFPRPAEPYLPNLKRAFFHLEGKITNDTAVEAFVVNIASIVHSAPNLEEIVAPQVLDHRDETPEAFRDLTGNYIFLNLLSSEEANIRLPNLRVIQIDAKLEDRDLRALGQAAAKFPNVDTLRIALSGIATRNELVFVLEKYSKTLKNLSISYSKTHGHRMTLESFFLGDNPLKKLEYLSLKNYPSAVVFVGAILSLKEFQVVLRNIGDCFPNDRDDFFLQPAPVSVSMRSSSSTKWLETCDDSEEKDGNDEDNQPPPSKKQKDLRVDPKKVHGLRSFHYIHHKEGTLINLYGDRCPFAVTRRIAMRFPQLTRLTLDNMTGESLTCVIKYLPLLEELTAVGGFYNDLSITGAKSEEDFRDPNFPKNRMLPYIGDLKYLHTLTISTFSMDSPQSELLSQRTVYYGLVDCKSLRRLTIGNERKNSTNKAKFETNIGDEPLYDLICALNLTYLKTVRSPISQEGFQKILHALRRRGIQYNINTYKGPLLPEEFFRKNRLTKPVLTLKSLDSNASRVRISESPSPTTSSQPSLVASGKQYTAVGPRRVTRLSLKSKTEASGSSRNNAMKKTDEVKKRRKRRYGRY